MKKIFWMLAFGMIITVFLTGCVATKKEVKKLTPEEQAIFQLFADMESAWNKQDASTYIKFWHDDLNLKLGSKQAPKYYTKSEYAEILPKRMADFGPFKMVNPKILKLEGDKAKAKVTVRKTKRDYKNTFNIVKVNGEWQIISNEW